MKKMSKMLALCFALSFVALSTPAQASYWTYGYYHQGCYPVVRCCNPCSCCCYTSCCNRGFYY